MSGDMLDIWGMRKRGKRDSARHAKRVKKAIKENLRDLISDISIISSDGKKKIKIPLRFLDNYRFKHAEDKNKEGIGQGNDESKPGDILGHDGTGAPADGKAGDKAGEDVYEEDVYEEDVEIAEIVNMMLEDLGLPWLESKDSAVEIETENIVFNDILFLYPKLYILDLL